MHNTELIEGLNVFEQAALVHCLDNPQYKYSNMDGRRYMNTLCSLGYVIDAGNMQYQLSRQGRELAELLIIQETTEVIPEEFDKNAFSEALGIGCF